MAKEPPRSFWNPNNLGPDLGYTQLKYNRGYTAAPMGTAGGGAGQRYANKHGLLYVFAETFNNARGARGWYTSFIHDQRDMNRATAIEYQNIVVANIKADIAAGGRQAVSTGRLVKVTENPRNRTSNEDHWGVGMVGYLDSSQAKYWRTQEEGTARAWKRSFIGDPLIGVWGGTIVGGKAGAPFTGAGANRSGKFRPFGRETRRRIASGMSKFGTPRPVRIARVTKEIDPMWAYRDAWAQIGGGRELAFRMLATVPGFTGSEVGAQRPRRALPRGQR